MDSALNICYFPSIRYTTDSIGYMYSNCNFYELTSGWVMNEGRWDQNVIPYAYPGHVDTLLNFDSLHVLMTDILISEIENQKELWLNLELLNNLFRNNLDSLKTGAAYKPVAVFEAGIKNIYDLFQDKRGFIWCTTRDGLVQIDPETGISSYYFDEDGLPTNMLYWGFDVAEDNTVYVCTTNGLVYFHPDSIQG